MLAHTRTGLRKNGHRCLASSSTLPRRCQVALLMSVALVIVWAQDGGDFDGGSFGGFDGGDGGGFGGGFGGGDDGGSFVGGGGDGGGDGGFDGGFDGTAVQPVYAAAPASITGPAVVLTRRRRSPASDPVLAPVVAESHRRVRRGGYGVVGPVHTYVRTDYDGNFKWGVRHHVGKSYGGGRGGGYGHY